MPEWNHIFHPECIEKWFGKKENEELNCPLWNIKILTNEEIQKKKDKKNLKKIRKEQSQLLIKSRR